MSITPGRNNGTQVKILWAGSDMKLFPVPPAAIWITCGAHGRLC